MSTFKNFCMREHRFDKLTNTALFTAFVIASAVYGWIYELLFYFVNGGCERWYWRGSCFGPWISIYAIGGVVIYLTTVKFKKHPWAVFAIGGIGCTLLEGGCGGIVWHFAHTRTWDYDEEIWNWGNIGGFVCLRSLLFFCLSSWVLMYLIIPALSAIAEKAPKALFVTVSFLLFLLFLADVVYNLGMPAKFPDLLYANSFYQSHGFAIMKF